MGAETEALGHATMNGTVDEGGDHADAAGGLKNGIRNKEGGFHSEEEEASTDGLTGGEEKEEQHEASSSCDSPEEDHGRDGTIDPENANEEEPATVPTSSPSPEPVPEPLENSEVVEPQTYSSDAPHLHEGETEMASNGSVDRVLKEEATINTSTSAVSPPSLETSDKPDVTVTQQPAAAADDAPSNPLKEESISEGHDGVLPQPYPHPQGGPFPCLRGKIRKVADGRIVCSGYWAMSLSDFEKDDGLTSKFEFSARPPTTDQTVRRT